VMLYFVLLNLLSQAAFALLAPFYPQVAKTKYGVQDFTVGIIMS